MTDPSISTAVAGDGDIFVLMSGYADLWRDAVAPFVPEGADLNGEVVYRGSEFLQWSDSGLETRLFFEDPQVVIVDRAAWVRIVNCHGEEVIRTFPLPRRTYSSSMKPQLTEIQLYAAWTSLGGAAFEPVEGDGLLPSGCFLPTAWGNRFVAVGASADGGERLETVLWVSDSGSEWVPDPVQPPAECSPFSLVVSGESLHLTSADGTQCCRRGLGADWIVLDEPCESCYKLAGPAGFLGYPTSFEYNKGLLSRNGVLWNEVPVPGVEPYPTLAVLDDSLVAMSVFNDLDSNHQVRIWVGATGST